MAIKSRGSDPARTRAHLAKVDRRTSPCYHWIMKAIKELRIKSRRIPIAAEDREAYGTRISSPQRAAIAVRALIDEADVEYFVVVPLDVKNRPLGACIVGQGSVDACQVDPREVFRPAILLGASGVLVAHNHPSGDLEASEEDLKITKRLIQCGEVLGLPVVDHLIITDGHYSLREEHPGLWG